MVKFFGENGEEMAEEIDPLTSLLVDTGRDEWIKYWEPIAGGKINYDRAFKIFEKSIELKSYSRIRQIAPYRIKTGYKLLSFDEGRILKIQEQATQKIKIIKKYSEAEFQELLLKRKRQKRKAFIDKALANEWTHWATLTFSPEVASEAAYDYAESKAAFMKWRKSVVRTYKYEIKYMAVAEYGGKNGRIHWHTLLYFDKKIPFEQAKSDKGKSLYLMNERGRNVLDENGKSIPKLVIPKWKYGNADFYPTYNDPERAVSYMAKYMTKNEDSAPYEQMGENAKSYLASKGLKTPTKEYILKTGKSKNLKESDQDKLEKASPTFRLLDDGSEVMRKTEAIVTEDGNVHAIKKKTGVIDIKNNPKSMKKGTAIKPTKANDDSPTPL